MPRGGGVRLTPTISCDNLDVDESRLAQFVEETLMNFDDRAVASSARRAYRIARLRGEVHEGHRLHLELSPLGGPKVDRYSTLMAMYPGRTLDEVRALHSEVIEEWIESRTPTRPGLNDPDGDDRVVHSGSTTEMVAGVEQLEVALQESLQDQEWHLRAKAPIRQRSAVSPCAGDHVDLRLPRASGGPAFIKRHRECLVGTAQATCRQHSRGRGAKSP